MDEWPWRPILDADDAEAFVAEWMRFAGFRDAAATPTGSDSGIDVSAADAVAQVKFYRDKPVGRPAVQQLYGAAAAQGGRALFFSASGYTRQAVGYATSAGIALFVIHRTGGLQPINRQAEDVWRQAQKLGPAVSREALAMMRVKARMLVVAAIAAVFVLGFTLAGTSWAGWLPEALIGVVALLLVGFGAIAEWVGDSLTSRRQGAIDREHAALRAAREGASPADGSATNPPVG